ncbi:MAG: hypothetical protein V4857_00760 [Pseudomonadota bacterium]
MDGALKPVAPAAAMLPTLMLRARLALAALGPVACAAALLCVLALATLAWLLPQRALQAQRQEVALAQATLPAPAPAAPPAADANLAAFYAALGAKRDAEQQVRTLFGLAAKNGLALGQGEYKDLYDPAARLYAYQVTLPLNGSYAALWQFSLMALGAMPNASLDEISFKRESIGAPVVQARVRLTLYLSGAAPGAPQ